MKIFKTCIYILLALAAVYGIVRWVSYTDDQREKGYAIYEACVEAQYHTTAAHYYQEHGVAPDCE